MGNLIKKLNRENFISQVKALHIDGWNIEDGVKVSTLNSILKKNNISYYSFEITNKCFDKYVTPNRNYPAMVYYCANQHMYWIGDKEKALSLIRGSQQMKFKIHSEMIQQYDDASKISF